jgi:hypothetical protein
MDIKNIYEKFSSSVSNPNIVEHFSENVEDKVEAESENNGDVYDVFIDKLVEDSELSEKEKSSLLRIKQMGDNKKELLFNYLMGLFNIYTNNVQSNHIKRVALEARKKEQAERLKDVGTTYKKSQGVNETVKREIQVNNYKFDSINYDLDVLKIILIGIGVLTLIPVVGFFEIVSKKVTIIIWALTLIGFGGYGGYSYFMKSERDNNNFGKYKFDKPSKNQVSGHKTDPDYEGKIEPRDASVGKIDKYINEQKGDCDAEDTESPADVTTTVTPTTQVKAPTSAATKSVCKAKPKTDAGELQNEDTEDKTNKAQSELNDKFNELLELIKENYLVCLGALGSIVIVIILGVFLYKKTASSEVLESALNDAPVQLQQVTQ